MLTCDLHDQPESAVETIAFGYDGYSYAFELCEFHLEEFNTTMQRYISAARREGRRSGRNSTTVASDSLSEQEAKRALQQQIRTWARRNGHQVSERGRIPDQVRIAYNQANLHQS